MMRRQKSTVKIPTFTKPKLYLLIGYPGSGKTHYRKNSKELKDLPCVDIAEIYQERPGTTPREARLLFIYKILDILDVAKELVGEIVGTDAQLEAIKFYLEDIIDIEIIHISTPKTTCVERVKEALKKEPDSPYQQARMYILENMP